MGFITGPMGGLLNFIYNNFAFKSYGLALIIFTIIIRVILLPLMVKQYHSMSRMQELNPKIQELQKQYKNDKEKLNQELMKVYQENNVNPAAGCLPLIIQLPILIGLWQVISKPLSYMLGISSDIITKLSQALNIAAVSGKSGYTEINIISQFAKDKIGNIIPGNTADAIAQMKSGFHFLGMNLGMTPYSDYSKNYLLLLIPLIAVTTTYISSKLSTPKTNQGAMGNSMQKSMLFMAPMMTLFFSFSFPAGMGIYWITGNVFQIFQQIFINNKILKKKEVKDK